MKTIEIDDGEEFMIVEGLHEKARICQNAAKGLGPTADGSAMRYAQDALEKSAVEYLALAKKVLGPEEVA